MPSHPSQKKRRGGRKEEKKKKGSSCAHGGAGVVSTRGKEVQVECCCLRPAGDRSLLSLLSNPPVRPQANLLVLVPVLLLLLLVPLLVLLQARRQVRGASAHPAGGDAPRTRASTHRPPEARRPRAKGEKPEREPKLCRAAAGLVGKTRDRPAPRPRLSLARRAHV